MYNMTLNRPDFFCIAVNYREKNFKFYLFPINFNSSEIQFSNDIGDAIFGCNDIPDKVKKKLLKFRFLQMKSFDFCQTCTQAFQ